MTSSAPRRFFFLVGMWGQVREDEGTSVEGGCAGMGRQAGLQRNRRGCVGRAGRGKCGRSYETHAIFRADGKRPKDEPGSQLLSPLVEISASCNSAFNSTCKSHSAYPKLSRTLAGLAHAALPLLCLHIVGEGDEHAGGRRSVLLPEPLKVDRLVCTFYVLSCCPRPSLSDGYAPPVRNSRSDGLPDVWVFQGLLFPKL